MSSDYRNQDNSGYASIYLLALTRCVKALPGASSPITDPLILCQIMYRFSLSLCHVERDQPEYRYLNRECHQAEKHTKHRANPPTVHARGLRSRDQPRLLYTGAERPFQRLWIL